MSMGSEFMEEEIVKLKKELAKAKENAARVIEQGCPSFAITKHPCAGCAHAAERVRQS